MFEFLAIESVKASEMVALNVATMSPELIVV